MKRCLIVDDSDVIRKVARRFVEELGYAVEEAESGARALEIVAKGMPDVIVLDWYMPGTTTVEILSAIRLSPRAARPFVFYLTSENDPTDIARALRAGADGVLMKPFDREQFVSKFALSGLAA